VIPTRFPVADAFRVEELLHARLHLDDAPLDVPVEGARVVIVERVPASPVGQARWPRWSR